MGLYYLPFVYRTYLDASMFVYLLHDAKEFWLVFLGNGKNIEAPFELKKHIFFKNT